MYRSRRLTTSIIKMLALACLLASSGLAAQVGWPPSKCEAACHASATNYYNTNPDDLEEEDLREAAGERYDECKAGLCS